MPRALWRELQSLVYHTLDGLDSALHHARVAARDYEVDMVLLTVLLHVWRVPGTLAVAVDGMLYALSSGNTFHETCEKVVLAPTVDERRQQT